MPASPRPRPGVGAWLRSTTKNGSIRALATARRGRSGETLAFAHIPTGITANKGFDIHHKSKFVELTIALTAIGPTPKSAELHLNARLRVFHKSGSTSRDGIDRQDHADAGDGKRENYRNTVKVHCRFLRLANCPSYRTNGEKCLPGSFLGFWITTWITTQLFAR